MNWASNNTQIQYLFPILVRAVPLLPEKSNAATQPPQFPVPCQKNETQFGSELDSSHELRSHNSRPRSVEQADSASAASSWARPTSPVSIAFLAD